MRILFTAIIIGLAIAGVSSAAATYELEAKKFVTEASGRVFRLYDGIANETYAENGDEDFETIFNKIETVKKIAMELTEVAEEARNFDLSKINDAELTRALTNLRTVDDLFVLGEDYFTSILITISALRDLSTDKDIEPYMGGANMPDNDNSPIAYYPDIQKIFKKSKDADELKYYWETWRNKNYLWASVNFFTIIEAFREAAKRLEVPVLELFFSDTENKDFLVEMERVMQELQPAYKQLHAFVRHELHKKYGSDVIDPNGPIPDHLFQQVLEQDWYADSVIESYFPHNELPPYDDFVKGFDALKLLDEADRFYTSLGFAPLTQEFRTEQLKEHDEHGNTGDCRADIFDLTPHIYMKYCTKVSFRKFMQNHAYLSRVHYAIEKRNLPAYYFSAYDLEYPVGEAVILSASTPKHLKSIGVAKDFQFTEKTLMNRLFRLAMHTMLNVPLFFVHTKVMNDLLIGKVEMDGINKYYWKLMADYAGIEPPLDRGEEDIDFPFKFYLDIEENHQTKKFLSEILGYQFYRAFCKKSAQNGPLHNCDFYGNLSIGNDLKSMMSLGSSKPWQEVIAKVLPDKPQLSADAMLEYYTPILDWLKAKNTELKLKVGWNPSKKKVV